jgi:DNA-binding FadR family transcriptional regulator
MNFEPIAKRTISEEVMERLADLIINGHFQPGAKLPTERDLAQRFAVARGPIREALRGLAMIGMVKIKPSEGSFVGELGTLPREQLLWVFHREKKKVREIYEARRIIETELIRLAAKNATEKQRKNIEKLYKRMKQIDAKNNIEEFIRVHTKFNDAIGEASGNAVLLSLMRTLHVLQEKAHRKILQLPGAVENSLLQDGKICNAILVSSEECALKAARDHFEAALELLELYDNKKRILEDL